MHVINPLSIEASVHPFQQIFKRSQFLWQERHEIIFEIETLKVFKEMKKHLQLSIALKVSTTRHQTYNQQTDVLYFVFSNTLSFIKNWNSQKS